LGPSACPAGASSRLLGFPSTSTYFIVPPFWLWPGPFSSQSHLYPRGSRELAQCPGDSGGPLVCYLPTAWVLVGLASWGLDCWHPAYPSIFTRVTYFTNWIDEVMRLTPLPDPALAPHTRSPPKPLRAAGLPGPCAALVLPQTWFLLPLTLRVPWQTL
uniref:Peptidase S1 domain-containing protein n=1 Tax=Piliocolobus tephrosceles TaxID=591936 RepID=A0A8C9GGH9_9PRIM